MESLYLLIPLSAGLVLAIIAVFGWALNKGQFEDLEAEGARILLDDTAPVDADQVCTEPAREQSRVLKKPPL
ncbi:MAG: cbb3-type cytochrome oxidase assembly protein CcoS [Rubrivivax sp.]|nr:cbb3-type cytochrome oxidase assembly protein CcoS [Rubrivivax sp.]